MTAAAVQQRQDALKTANRVRSAVCQLKRDLAALTRPEGCARLAQVVRTPPDELGAAKVYKLLLHIHRVGESTARRILHTAAIPEGKRLRDLTPRQVEALATVLGRASFGVPTAASKLIQWKDLSWDKEAA